ncbi:hypothetical protein [Novosphingobium kaempferiae]|uniref:hypothetical protein n=1 Tax=Novosphingobium kaempferiae TaxID=2896849 RepID=UPI001E590272|nr:hypothetical protein [Novosphingobium kaempferiae]
MTLRLLPLVLLSLSPATAWAQIVGPPVPQSDRVTGISGIGPYATEMRETRRNIDDARDAGQLSKREAKAFRKEARRTDALAERYASDGISPSEARELDMRARALDSLAGAARGRSDSR